QTITIQSGPVTIPSSLFGNRRAQTRWPPTASPHRGVKRRGKCQMVPGRATHSQCCCKAAEPCVELPDRSQLPVAPAAERPPHGSVLPTDAHLERVAVTRMLSDHTNTTEIPRKIGGIFPLSLRSSSSPIVRHWIPFPFQLAIRSHSYAIDRTSPA